MSQIHESEMNKPRPGRPRDPAIDKAFLEATRRRLLEDGYSCLSLGDVAADAGSSRPALYRRWRTKNELVADAFKYGYAQQNERQPPIPLDELTPKEGFEEAVRRIDPRFYNPNAIALQGGVMAEAEREPEVLQALQEHGVGPRIADFTGVVRKLQEQGAIRDDIDIELLASIGIGTYFGEFLRGESRPRTEFVRDFAAKLWAMVAIEPEVEDGGSGAEQGR